MLAQQCDRVGVLLERPGFRRDRKLSEQINDASISVLFNIAEGFLRRRDKETLQFPRYAFASNGELKSGYYVASGRNYLPADETDELITLNETIAKMLRGGRPPWNPRNRGAGPRTSDAPRTKAHAPRTFKIGLCRRS